MREGRYLTQNPARFNDLTPVNNEKTRPQLRFFKKDDFFTVQRRKKHKKKNRQPDLFHHNSRQSMAPM